MPLSTLNTRGKVKELDELSKELRTLQAQGKKIIHSHGVFDLLHIGHLRHFEEAKKLGDILVVTITPDRFVNKGPHRPAFGEDLRAEAVSALTSVDYVAISKWPMATDLIRLLKPDYYVKGSDYKDASKDVTGGIDLERAAIEEIGGQIAFTDDITFSASTLINQHFQILSKDAGDFLSRLSEQYTIDDISTFIDGMKPLKVLVVGESIIDQYVYCEAIGKSGKEPMLAIKQMSEEKFAGGILAVGNNIANFADGVGVISFLGDDGIEDEFIKDSLDEKIKVKFLHRHNSPTIVKKRFIEQYFFTKLLSVYTINDAPLAESDEEALCDLLTETIPAYDVVLVVDFGHSMLTPKVAKVICNKARFLAVNTQSNAGNLGYQTIYKYPKTDYLCITESELRLEVRDRISDLKDIIPKLAKELNAKEVVVTRGNLGSMGYNQQQGFVSAPALAGKVVDRMGAGDAFLAITSLCAVQHAPLDVLQFIGNAVGAQAVATVGHRQSIGRVPLIKYLTTLLK